MEGAALKVWRRAERERLLALRQRLPVADRRHWGEQIDAALRALLAERHDLSAALRCADGCDRYRGRRALPITGGPAATLGCSGGSGGGTRSPTARTGSLACRRRASLPGLTAAAPEAQLLGQGRTLL